MKRVFKAFLSSVKGLYDYNAAAAAVAVAVAAKYKHHQTTLGDV